MIRIIADDKIPFLRGALEPYAGIIYLPGSRITPETIAGADALLIRTRTKCNEALLGKSNVRFIATATIGFDHIDAGFCNERNICWTNAPGCNAGSVQQYIASVLATLSVKHCFSLRGKTLGVIGVGNVGKKVEVLGRILGMKILLNDPPRAREEGSAGFVALDELLQASDIVTIHVPLNVAGADKTFHLFDEQLLRKMNQGAWLINSSRGEVVDGSALRDFLETGKIAGAVLDVWENEPAIDSRLLEKVTIATPHIAGYSVDGKRNGTAMVVRAAAGFFNLPLMDWDPLDIPAPGNPMIDIDCSSMSEEEVLCRAILHTYNVLDDDARLRQDVAGFENQRGNYPVRREFPAYTVLPRNAGAQVKVSLGNLGFLI